VSSTNSPPVISKSSLNITHNQSAARSTHHPSALSLLLSTLSPYGGWPKRRNHGKHFSNRQLVVGDPTLHRYIISPYSEQEHQQRQWNFLLKPQLSQSFRITSNTSAVVSATNSPPVISKSSLNITHNQSAARSIYHPSALSLLLSTLSPLMVGAEKAQPRQTFQQPSVSCW